MSLDQLEKDIQSHDSKAVNRKHDKTVYNEWQSKEIKHKESSWQKIINKMQGTRVKAIVLGGIIITIIVCVILAAVAFMFFQDRFFSQERVKFLIEAPQTSKSNVLTEITFDYDNSNRASLEDAEIVVRYGDYFVPEDGQDNFRRVSNSQGVIDIGTIKGHKNEKIILVGHFVGPRDAVADISGTLRYTPEDFTTQYNANARSSTVIATSPITIDIESPQEIVSGNLMDIIVKVQNTSADPLTDLKLVFDMPEGFSLQGASPRFTNGSTWLIENIGPQGEEIFSVRGGLNASIGSVQKFNAEVGTQESGGSYVTYASSIYAPRIIQTPIRVQQEIDTPHDGVIYAGDDIHYSVIFTNDSDIPLRDAIVTLNLEGDVVDFETLQLDNRGDYQQDERRIVWKAADVPELKVLEPKESGRVSFSVKAKTQLPVDNENDHHFFVTSIASIDSEDIPSQLRENKTVLSNVASLPIGAKVVISSDLKSVSGTSPLKVGKKGIYEVMMRIDNINNDITNAVVHIPLPTHTTFEGGDSVEYNERTNEIEWNIGDIKHGAGVTSDSVTTSFDVSIIPSIDQVNDVIVIIKEQKFTGLDSYTNLEVEEFSREKHTGSGDQDGVVKQ